MADPKEEIITSEKNSEEHQKLVNDYEASIDKEKQKTLEWKNAYLKSEQERKVLKETKERVEEERDDWKQEAHSARKIHQQTKQHKEEADFEQEFIKLQQNKRINN